MKTSIKQMETTLPDDTYPDIEQPTEYDFNFRDALITSHRRKDLLLRSLMEAGAQKVLVSFISREAENFEQHRLQADIVLKAIKELSVSLPTTSISEVKWTNNTRANRDIPEPISIPREELIKANHYMLEAQEEEKKERVRQVVLTKDGTDIIDK